MKKKVVMLTHNTPMVELHDSLGCKHYIPRPVCPDLPTIMRKEKKKKPYSTKFR